MQVATTDQGMVEYQPVLRLFTIRPGDGPAVVLRLSEARLLDEIVASGETGLVMEGAIAAGRLLSVFKLAEKGLIRAEQQGERTIYRGAGDSNTIMMLLHMSAGDLLRGWKPAFGDATEDPRAGNAQPL